MHKDIKEIKTGLPDGFKATVMELLGAGAEAYFKAMKQPPTVSVRLNSRKAHEEIFSAERSVAWCHTGRYLDERPAFTLDPLLHAGCYYVQDASSMVYRQIADLLQREGMRFGRVLDMCAAPGGKTTAMIDALPDGVTVVANEVNGKRRVILEENLAKWGYPGVIVTGSVSSDFAKLGETFDLVAVDAPCSGEGMMRKEEEAVRQWSPRLVEDCAALQREILREAVAALRPGGVLIYSTCTFNVHENEGNARYIAGELGLEPLPLPIEGLPEGCTSLAEKLGAPSSMRFMQHITEGEGLFVAVFKKRGTSPRHSPQGSELRRGFSKSLAGKAWAGPCMAWVRSSYNLQELQNQLRALTADGAELLEHMRGKVRVTMPGTLVATIKGKDLIPATDLAMSGALRRGVFPEMELSREEALRYLRHEAVEPRDNTPKGFVLVTYIGHPLGFVKNIGRRTNNLYPQAWRIRNL